ncbi:MAG: hypothetical protein ACW98D_09435 [Promethearchaeota archaeon]|jgi:hypothetical protein
MNKKEKDLQWGESTPKIIDIEEQEIEEKKPPNSKIIEYKIVDDDDTS